MAATSRFILAVVATPLATGIAAGVPYYIASGSRTWLWVLIVASYIAMLVVGFPISAILMKSRSLGTCLLAGVVTATVPAVLLAALSLFSTATSGSFNALLMLIGLGAFGGVFFWVVAFAGVSAPHP